MAKRIAVLIALSLALSAFPALGQQPVRVKVIGNSRQLSLRCQGYCRVLDARTQETVVEGETVQAQIKSSRDGLLFDGRRLSTDMLAVLPEDDAVLTVNGRAFRGELRISAKKRDAFTVVNRIGLEDYLKGISVAETSHYWPMDALRAQAVVFRTYALYQKEQNAARDYDLSADVSSQVYAGRGGERYRFSQAVDDTSGEVLQYGRRILPAFFHSTCGGHTENAAELWSLDSPPLAGVLCPYCTASPHYAWKTVVPASQLAVKLFAKTRYAGKRIGAVEIIGRNASGRVKNIRIRTDAGALVLSGKDFRARAGVDSIRSTNFEVTAKGASFVFTGRGWGHGAGLCQWGAYSMAKAGADYKEILEYYYPQASLVTVQ